MTEAIGRAANAHGQWEDALAFEARLAGTSGRARLAARLTAIEAFRRVHTAHGGDDEVRARAALAAGRHLTTLGFDGEAYEQFDAAVRLAIGDAQRFEARAARADASRRAEDWAGAERDYAWCADTGRGVERVVALLRLGDARSALGEPRRAHDAWVRAIELGDACTELVEVYDRVAREALARGDDAAAAGWLEACRAALREPLASRTPQGERIRRAFVAMRARHELRCRAFERAVFDEALHDVVIDDAVLDDALFDDASRE